MTTYNLPNLMEEPVTLSHPPGTDKILLLLAQNEVLIAQYMKQVDDGRVASQRAAVLLERERCAQIVENSQTISDQQWFKDTLAGIAAVIRAGK